MAEKRITIELSEDQHNLLLKYYKNFADTELVRLCSKALEEDDAYKIRLTETQLEDLCRELSSIADHEKDPEEQDRLDDLAEYLENYMLDFEDDEEDEEEDRDEYEDDEE